MIAARPAGPPSRKVTIGLRRPSLLAASLALVGFLGPSAPAGTTGVPGINDYTINGGVSGSTSCASCPFTSPVTLNFTVSTGANLPVIYAFTACPCTPHFAFQLPVGCALPFISFSGTTNHSIDLNSSCPLVPVATVSNSAGMANVSVSLPLQGSPPWAQHAGRRDRPPVDLRPDAGHRLTVL